MWLLSGTHDIDAPAFSFTYLVWGVALGGLSAVSLPLGSALGLIWQPRPQVVAAFTAFGGGALMAALTIELVAPTAAAAIGSSAHIGHHNPHMALYALIGGMVAGGLLFILLDQLVNAKGGFLRKGASTMLYIAKRRRQRKAVILDQLSRIGLLRHFPPEHMEKIVDVVRPKPLAIGEVLFRQGEEGKRLYFIERGSIRLERDGREIATLQAGDVVGEIALLTGGMRTATATATSATHTLSIGKEDFELLCHQIPELGEAARKVARQRLEELDVTTTSSAQAAHEWAEAAKAALSEGVSLPSTAELQQARHEHGGAPLAIWLGILLDGIPESFVIGAGFLGLLAMKLATAQGAGVSFGEVVPYTLIAGLFLSNFPEAMSSSVGMRNQGWGKGKVLFMWVVLMVVTAAGAGVGYMLGGSADHDLVVGIEGMAAGAMLIMIVAAMIPEALHLGGAYVTGCSLLMGFLAAVAFKLFEG